MNMKENLIMSKMHSQIYKILVNEDFSPFRAKHLADRIIKVLEETAKDLVKKDGK